MSTSCLSCTKFKRDKHALAIKRIQSLYESSQEDWILGFSGGKDSTALLALLIRSLEQCKNRNRLVRIVYCNTGVEIPVVSKHTLKKIAAAKKYCEARSLPIKFHVAAPSINDRYFVKVIGRGYVPPTNKFRWCTDRLRIKPVDKIVKRYVSEKSLILLGVREGESNERDRVISTYKQSDFLLRQAGRSDRTIFAPILDFTTEDVWGVISSAQDIFGNLSAGLLQLYREASGECPTIRDPKSSPCSQGRFGCWTCTVVRTDKAVTSLVAYGHDEMLPLLQFRNWLISIRDEKDFREKRRRNGAHGMGPFTLKARQQILRRLKQAERASGLRLISPSEIKEIKKLWLLDAS